jgi:hypothetical protein
MLGRFAELRAGGQYAEQAAVRGALPLDLSSSAPATQAHATAEQAYGWAPLLAESRHKALGEAAAGAGVLSQMLLAGPRGPSCGEWECSVPGSTILVLSGALAWTVVGAAAAFRSNEFLDREILPLTDHAARTATTTRSAVHTPEWYIPYRGVIQRRCATCLGQVTSCVTRRAAPQAPWNKWRRACRRSPL